MYIFGLVVLQLQVTGVHFWFSSVTVTSYRCTFLAKPVLFVIFQQTLFYNVHEKIISSLNIKIQGSHKALFIYTVFNVQNC